MSDILPCQFEPIVPHNLTPASDTNKMAGRLLLRSSRYILLVLFVSSLWPTKNTTNLLPNQMSLFVALKLDSKTFPGRNSDPQMHSRGHALPPCLKIKSALSISKIGMSALCLVILSGDVSLNPGPSGGLTIGNDMAISPPSISSSNEDSHSEFSDDSSSVDLDSSLLSDSECDLHTYFDLGL